MPPHVANINYISHRTIQLHLPVKTGSLESKAL